MIAINPGSAPFKCGIVRNDTFATRASLSDLGALEYPFGLLDFPFCRSGSYEGRLWIQQCARRLPPRRLLGRARRTHAHCD
jgi:hypothetical protein